MGYDRDEHRGRQSYGRNGYGNEYGRREERYVDDGYAYGDQRDFGRHGGDNRNYSDRGFIERAGDEVRSWFGDEKAERRRERDTRYDFDRGGASNGAYGDRNRYDYSRGYARDVDRSRGEHNDGFFDRVGRWFEGDAPHNDRNDHNDYRGWRTRQIEDLDRDYHEYRQENRSRFENEFGEFRNRRQTQRTSLSQIKEHFEVLGSDGEHVGKVDKVRGDRIILAKNDPAAGGHHHSIPSSWLQSVDGERVTITKTAAEAKQAWTDLDNDNAMFSDSGTGQGRSAHMLNRSFSGTY